MKDLTVSQSYMMCTLSEKGKFSALNTRGPVCLVAAGLIDLLFANCVAVGVDNKLAITGQLTPQNQHLESLYTFIKEAKPMKIIDLASQYALTFFDKKLKNLTNDVGESLIALGYATAENGGLLGKTSCFIPNRNVVDNIIQNIRAELLESGTISDNIIALLSLMEKSNQIKAYFSAYEKDQLKARLKEIKNNPSNKLVKEMVDYIDTIMVVIAAT